MPMKPLVKLVGIAAVAAAVPTSWYGIDHLREEPHTGTLVAQAPDQGLCDLAVMIHSQCEREDEVEHRVEYVRRDTRGQDPHVLFVGCADSFCGGVFEAAGISHAPDRVFKGDNPGNSLVQRVHDERDGQVRVVPTPSVAYFVEHIAHLTSPAAPAAPAAKDEAHGDHHGAQGEHGAGSDVYLVVIEGHTLCGAMGALLGDFSREGPSLYEHLDTLGDQLQGTLCTLRARSDLTPAARAALLAQANVDAQVAAFMRMYPDFVASGRGHVIGLLRDLTGNLVPAGSEHRRGQVYLTNVDGSTDAPTVAATLERVLGDRVDPVELRTIVRRVPAPETKAPAPEGDPRASP